MAKGTQPSVDVVAGVIFRHGLILIARRNPGGPHGGLWEFPGGKVEPGESPEEALARELLEELGAHVAVLGLMKEVIHSYRHATIRLLAYRCEIAAGEPSPLECAELKWVEPRDLSNYEMPEADGPIRNFLADEKG